MNKCSLLGHDWFERPVQGKRRCMRCDKTEPYSKEEQHQDPDAEKGETRIVVEELSDGIQIRRENYTRTATGPDTEYWQWWAGSPMRVTDADALREIHELTEQYGDTDG